MKNYLLLVFCIVLLPAKSQIVFCPNGAEWSYNFLFTAGGNPAAQKSLLERITYIRDSTLGTEVVKVLKHRWFYMECGEVSPGLTLIKQKGDTVFMRNPNTNNNWEILYNFNVQAGESWQTTVKKDAYGSNSAVSTYTIKIDSVKTVVDNGFNIKRLFVRYSRPSGHFSQATISERFGCNYFMFNYYNNSFGACDAEWFQRPLCYKDDQFGAKLLSSFPCDYPLSVGIKEYDADSFVKLSPSPANTVLHLDFENKPLQNCQIAMHDISGKLVMELTSISPQNDRASIDLSHMENGFYFVSIYTEGQWQSSKKILKQ